MLATWKKSYDQPKECVKKQRHYFANKGPSSQCYGFYSSHVWRWELDCKEGWVPKNWCFWTMVLEKTLQSPLDSREAKPVNPKGNQSWIFIGRVMLKLKPPKYFSHLMRRTNSLENTLMLGKIEGERRRGWQEMRWHHWLNGHEFEQTQGDGEGQGRLACCSSWGCKELGTI